HARLPLCGQPPCRAPCVLVNRQIYGLHPKTKYLCFFAKSITLVHDSRSSARLFPNTEKSTPKALDYLQLMEPLKRIPNARAGRVDKFQGQQAPVVIYSVRLIDRVRTARNGISL